MISRPCFVRFGHLNSAGKSYNYRDHHWEKGHSVFSALYYEDFDQYDLVMPTNPGRGLINTVMGLVCNTITSRCPVFEVTGKVLDDLGTEGEPLLVNVKINKELKIVTGVIVSKQNVPRF